MRASPLTLRILKMQNLILLLVILQCSLALILAEEWDPESFKKKVIDDDKVWLVEFYSPRCGGCQEFSPTWEKVVESMKSILTTKVNIEEAGGMALAQQLNVLREGIPNVRIIKSKGVKPNGESVVIGNQREYSSRLTLHHST